MKTITNRNDPPSQEGRNQEHNLKTPYPTEKTPDPSRKEKQTMKQDYTHILIVLDASGSMSSIQDDIKGSFNEFLKKQREAEGKTVFDLYQFSDASERIVRSADLSKFHDDLMAKYSCSGCTALNDAVCTAIDTIGREFADMPESERPGHVLCVIITDGMENASREFTTRDVKARIRHQQDVYSWDFQFLAADQDAFAAGEALGVSRDNCMYFSHDLAGVNMLYDRMTDCMESIREKNKNKNKKK